MPDAVIVATARSPIGRAAKGSLVDLRPDDLTATIVEAALAKVPALDPHLVEDLYLGCGLPGGEQGFNMARVVAVMLGLDKLPGATITRYCSSSLQTTRMAFHAIKAGEGDVFISAGVEMRLALRARQLRRPPAGRAGGGRRRMAEPALRRGLGAHREASAGRGTGMDRSARRGSAPVRLHGDGSDRGERRAGLERHPRGDGRVRRTQPEQRREGDQRRILGPRDHPGHHTGTARSSAATTARGPV